MNTTTNTTSASTPIAKTTGLSCEDKTIEIRITRTTCEYVDLDIALFRKVFCPRKDGEEENVYLKRSLEIWTQMYTDEGCIEIEGSDMEDFPNAEGTIYDHYGTIETYVERAMRNVEEE